jgi:hypothetical protein
MDISCLILFCGTCEALISVGVLIYGIGVNAQIFYLQSAGWGVFIPLTSNIDVGMNAEKWLYAGTSDREQCW